MLLGTNALDAKQGLTDNDWEVVQVKRAMIESSSKVVSLAIAEKLNTVQRIRVCETKDIDVLITELDPESPELIPYKKNGLKLLL